MLYKVLQEMAAYIDYVNLGGQETNTLRRFYLRFDPLSLEEKEKKCYDGQYSATDQDFSAKHVLQEREASCAIHT